jgi:hypothetical protein
MTSNEFDSEYRIEPFSEENFRSLQKLFKSAFGADVSLEAYKHKYTTHSIGGKAINYVGISNISNEVVAHFGALPVKAILNNRIVIAAQSSDAMTDERHRGKGLFKLLAEKVHGECKAKEIAFVFSQPNTASYHSFLNVFKFQYVDDINRWDLKLKFKTAPLAKIFIHSRFTNVYLGYCDLVLKRYKVATPVSFTNSLSIESIKIFRDQFYLEYKKSSDKHFVQIDGVVLWIKLADIFWIGEVSEYHKVTERVLKKIKRLAFLLGYNTISFHLNAKVPQPEFLARFKKYNSEPSTVFYLDKTYTDNNLILTGCDFDTW